VENRIQAFKGPRHTQVREHLTQSVAP
jgi:hypothetical protein